MTENKPAVFSNEWLTTQETMDALGKAQRTVQEMAQNGSLAFKLAPRPGNRPERMYSAADVRRHAAAAKPSTDGAPRGRQRFSEETARAREMPRQLPPPPPSPVDPAIVRIRSERWELEREERELQLLRQKSWLKPSECSKLEGLPSRTVVELAEGGKLVGMRCGRGWRISRVSLEGFTPRKS